MPAPQVLSKHGGVPRYVGDDVFGFSHAWTDLLDESRVDQIAHRANQGRLV